MSLDPLLPLHAAARWGRPLLIFGLAAGVALPALAEGMRAYLPELVATLLFVSALRIGPKEALGALKDLRLALGYALLCQFAAPVLAIGIFSALDAPLFGWTAGLVLMLSAPSISGNPNIAIMMGRDPAPALRLMVIGTALLPLTALPTFAALPALDPWEALRSALRLAAVISVAAGAAFLVRGYLIPRPSARALKALDGAGAIMMAVLVIGLMSAVGPALSAAPISVLAMFGLVFAANFGLQIAAGLSLRAARAVPDPGPYGLVAGNRNIALFLTSLPEEATAPLLLFIGCYQAPMYLTPVLLKGFYAWTAKARP